MKIASWRRRKAALRKPAVVTAVATNEKEVAVASSSSAAAEEKEAVSNDMSSMIIANDMSSMIMQATELVTIEADDGNDATAALGDMEITLRAMKPSPVVTTPSQQTDDMHHGRDGSNNAVVQTPTRDYADGDSSPIAAGVVEQGELKTDESEKMAAAADGGQEVGVGQEEERKAESSSSEKNILPAQRSPTSQFELDVLNATHPTVDFENLQKCSRALLDDDDDKSISSEESQRSDDDSILSDAASVNAKVQKDDEVLDFVHDILSPMDCAADYMFCQMQCAFPNIVEDANEIMTTNLHHLMFCGEGEEEEAKEEGGGAVVVESDGAGDDNRGEGDNDQGGEDEEDVVVVFGTSPDEQGEGGAGQDDETADEQEEDEGGEEIVVDEQQDSLEVDVVLGRWVKMQEDQLEIASYSPGGGFVLRKDGKLPELSEDEVLIRVDATVISTRDCLERIRRDTTEDLKDDVWVPGHEIVGHVVRAGAGMEAKSLMDKRIAAVLPYGGGCSQYVSIHANDVIVLPDEADSNEVVPLLSTYMTAYQCLESVADIEAKEEEGEEEAKVGEEEEEEAEAISSNKDDAEQKKSHLFGKNVLIIDSGSPVGLALVNLATNAGATVHTVPHLISHFNAIRWSGTMDLIVDVVGDSDNNPSYYKIMKTRGRLVRVNTTSCEKRYVPHAVAGKIEGGKDTSYYGRVINDKAIDYNVFHSFNDDKEEFAEDLAYLHDLRQIGKIEPKLFSQVGFDELGEGWEKLMAEGGNGVVVVSPWKLGFTTVHG